jgi:hypothetical protein
MRRSLILCGIVTLLSLGGCNRRGEEQTVPTSSIPPSGVPFPPPPTLINTTLPANQIVFVEINTDIFGTESGRCEHYF